MFKSETKKNILLLVVISSHMGPMYVDTPYSWLYLLDI